MPILNFRVYSQQNREYSKMIKIDSMTNGEIKEYDEGNGLSVSFRFIMF